MRWDGFFTDSMLYQGRKYYEQGIVRNIRANGNTADAEIVFKSKTLKVSIAISQNTLQSITCSCEKERCSHMTAFLTALDQSSPDFLPDFAEPYFLICKKDDYLGHYTELCKYFGSDETVVVPDGVERLGHGIFSNHAEIKKVVLPETLKSISHHVFSNCTSLEEINLPRELAGIDDYAFDNCYKLADDNGLIEVRGHLFRNDRNRTGKLNIPNGIVSIGGRAFQDNEFDEISIPSTVTSIGEFAFAGSAKVKKIIVPDSVEDLGDETFADSVSLETVSLPGGIECLINTFAGCISLKEVVIPNTVQCIEGAFEECYALTEIELPRSVEEIRGGFINCTNLKKLTINGSNIEIDDLSFDGCENLQIFCSKTAAKKIPAKYRSLLAGSKPVSKEPKAETFNIYQNMEKLSRNTSSTLTINSDWPKEERYTVNCNGFMITIQTYLAKGYAQFSPGGYDAYSAIESMYARQLEDSEILWETDGEPQFDDPEFDYSKLVLLEENDINNRIAFTAAIANLISNQETMEAIVSAAEKKKDGSLHKGRILKIASSGVAGGLNNVIAIVARAKTAVSMSVTIEDYFCKPGDNELWANDFISTYHEGLPVSEELKKIFG